MELRVDKMSPAEKDYSALREQVSCPPGSNPQITCSSNTISWDWSLGSINEEEWDSTAADQSFELNRLKPSFRRFIRLLPLFLADPNSVLCKSSHSPFKADLRASMRLIDFVLQKLTTILVNDMSFEITQMLLTRLRFFISWKRFESLRRDNNAEVSVVERECRIAQKQWLDVLLDPKQGKRFEFWAEQWSRDYSDVLMVLERSLFPSLESRRGSEAKLVVFNGKTARFCQTDHDRRYLEVLVRGWFLPQYDLAATRSILQATSIFDRGWGDRLFRAICRPHCVGSLSVYIGLLCLGLLVVSLPWFVIPSQLQYVSRLLDILLWVGLIWVILISCGVFCWGNIALTPHVPRLAAATLVGLFGLAISDLPWKFSIQGFSQAPALSMGLCVLSILLVLGYFSWEIGSSGASRPEVFRRSGVLLLIGLTQALFFSNLFALFVADRLYRPDLLDSNTIKTLESSGRLALYSIDTSFGKFYPSLAALYGFGSLAGGTLLQVLWQERRITSTDVVPT